MRIGSVVLIVWLIIGVIAANQRGYLTKQNLNCSRSGTIAVTIVAGPLNYFGLDPKINCQSPSPSN